MLANDKLIFALPKGRILRDVMPLVNKVGIEPEAAFEDGDDRRLRFATNEPNVDIIRVRSIDMGTILSFGAAHFGIAGADVLTELDSLWVGLLALAALCRCFSTSLSANSRAPPPSEPRAPSTPRSRQTTRDWTFATRRRGSFFRGSARP